MRRRLERVLITGMGVVSPIGCDADAFGHAIREGRSGVGPIRAFDPTGLETRIAAEVADSFDPKPHIRPLKMMKLMNRATLFAVAAAAEARARAGLGSDDVASERIGVALGAGGMGPVDPDLANLQAEALLAAARESGEDQFRAGAFAEVLRTKLNPLSLLRGLPNLAAAHVAIQHGAQGPNTTVSTACTAGTQAIGDGLRMIQRGEADVVLAGGSDAMVNPLGVLGFGMLGTLSRRNEDPSRASRPFDRDRDGFVIGEGAAVVVLEREEHARSRSAPVLAELAGYASTCDAWRLTDERPDAAGASAAIRRCLEDSDAAADDVDYVNAHGTGTRMNDTTEAAAIRQVFGTRTDHLPVSSTKSMIGHLLAGAGAVELAASLLALRGRFVPPTINCTHPDPDCPIDPVPLHAREAAIDTVLSNSFGFGGQNACLLIRRA